MAAQKLELPDFPQRIRRFLYDQKYPNARFTSSQVSIDAFPIFEGKICVFYSASATFRAPSDPSSPSGMRREYIRATPAWRKSRDRYDCVFINARPELVGMRGLEVARVFHLCTRIFTTHALLSDGFLLLVINQKTKRATVWWNPTFTKTDGRVWQFSISTPFIALHI